MFLKFFRKRCLAKTKTECDYTKEAAEFSHQRRARKATMVLKPEDVSVENSCIRVMFSESKHPLLQSERVIPFAEANVLFEQRDSFCRALETTEEVSFKIYYDADGEQHTINEIQTLGDGTGTLINRLKISTMHNLEFFEASAVAGIEQTQNRLLSVIKGCCENMMNIVLPKLEELCLAYEAKEKE